jgi:hypothetical protein
LQSIKQQDFDDKKLELQQTKELYERLVSSHRDLEIAQLAFDATKRELKFSTNRSVENRKICLFYDVGSASNIYVVGDYVGCLAY